MKKINIVYAYMREPRYEIALPERDASTVFWTREEVPGSDVVVYLNGYSYDRKAARETPGAFRILYAYEPLSVYPVHFTRRFWRSFDAVLTWNDLLAGYGGKFHYFPTLCYDFPFGAVHGVLPEGELSFPDPSLRRRALCQIVGDKYSPMVGQLYSLRRAAARWFHDHGQLDMDVYGFPAMNVPGHKGRVESKLDTMRKYRYALCFENLHHPVWSRGYVTEKIFDGMAADCVPVYYGAVNIEKYIPENCFIDFRQFSDFAELDAFLAGLSDEAWLSYVQNIRTFLSAHNAAHRYSCFRLYEAAEALANEGRVSSSVPLPPGFFETASLREKAAYSLMACGLKAYRFIHPAFDLLRRAQRCRSR